MTYFSFGVLDGKGQQLSVSRNVVFADNAVEALREARQMYPGKVIANLHEMDFEHGQREYRVQEWDLSLPNTLKAALTVVGMAVLGIVIAVSDRLPKRGRLQ